MKKPACGPAFSWVPKLNRGQTTFSQDAPRGIDPVQAKTWSDPFALHRCADPLRHFPILLDDAAEIAAEAVLVHLVVRPVVPEPAAVGREFVAEDQRSAHVVHGMPYLQVVVDQVAVC